MNYRKINIRGLYLGHSLLKPEVQPWKNFHGMILFGAVRAEQDFMRLQCVFQSFATPRVCFCPLFENSCTQIIILFSDLATE